MRKVTILLGAGAALPWGAPNTKDITEAINNSTDHVVDGKTLGAWMNELLSSSIKSSQSKINFETYVDFLESVYAYLMEKTQTSNESIGLYRLFEIKQAVIDGIQKIRYSNGSSFNSDAHKIVSCFYSLIRIISNKTTKYINCYENKTLEINTKLRLFIEHFIKIGYSARSYTLNYDRNIPLVFENSDSEFKIFDGFDIQEHEAGKADLFFCNKTKILNDLGCNSFYNLHGSFHWSFQECPYKTTNSSFPFVLLSSKKYKYRNSADIENYLVDSNPNEKLLQSPIITGYKKTQRINLEPFNYFFHNFFQDIHQSEIIIIVGYSFSDPHINQLIRDAVRRKVRVYNITYKSNVIKKYTSYVGNWSLILKNSYPEQTNWFRDIEFFFSEYPNGFESFLLNEEWFWIQPI